MASSVSTVDEDFSRAHSKSVDFDSLFEAGGELAHHGDADMAETKQDDTFTFECADLRGLLCRQT